MSGPRENDDELPGAGAAPAVPPTAADVPAAPPASAASPPASGEASAPAAKPPRPAGAARSGPKKPKPPGSKSPRRRSRELALQGLYAWLARSDDDPAVIEAHIREEEDYPKCDKPHFEALLHGCVREAPGLDAVLARHTDRRTTQLSPVEHGVLMIGVYELMHCIEIPYRVVINEGVELAKSFGGTDGHKYVNGVLDKAAAELRTAETQAARR